MLTIATPVAAQQTVDEATQRNVALNDTVEQLKSEIVEFFRLEARLPETEPGFQDMLQSRLDERQREIFEDVDELAADLLRIERQGDSVDETKAQVVQWLHGLAERANAFLARNRQNILKLLEKQNSPDLAAAVEAAVDLGRAIDRSTKMNGSLYRTIEILDEFGIDVTDERAQLTNRVTESAEMLAVAIQLDADELARLRVRVTLSPDDPDLQTLIKIADLRRKSYASNLNETSRLLNELGRDSSEYRRLVLLVTGDVASQILDTGVMSGLVRDWGTKALTWVNNNGLGWAIKLIMLATLGRNRHGEGESVGTPASHDRIIGCKSSHVRRHPYCAVAARYITRAASRRPWRPGLHHRLCTSGHAGQFRLRHDDLALPALRRR